MSASHPIRIFTVTGTLLSPTAARTHAAARSGVFISAEPAPVFTTFGTGHPMLRSIQSGSKRPSMATARAMNSGSLPKSWSPMGRSISVMRQSASVPRLS